MAEHALTVTVLVLGHTYQPRHQHVEQRLHCVATEARLAPQASVGASLSSSPSLRAPVLGPERRVADRGGAQPAALP